MLLARSAGITAIVVGLVAVSVLIGWYCGIPSLIRIAPSFVAMQYNTAVALGLSAGLLYAFTIDRPSVSAALAVAVTAIGAVTLAEHLGGAALGIDELLWHLGVNRDAMQGLADVRQSAPGRMAPLTSLCLTLIGMSAVALARRPRPTARAIGVAAGMALLVVALATVALSGYVIGIPTTFGWGHLTRMALHTAISLVALGAGLQLVVMRSGLRQGLTLRRWVPALVGVLIAVSTMTMWQALVDRDRRNVERLVQRQAAGMGRMLARSISEYTLPSTDVGSGGRTEAQRLLAAVDEETAGAYACALHDGNRLLARCRMSVDARTRIWTVSVPVQVGGLTWKLAVTPSEATLDENTSGVPLAFLLSGFSMALFAALVTRAAQRSNDKSRRLALLVDSLAVENEARRAAEQRRDEHAEKLVAQADELALQNEVLRVTAVEMSAQREEMERAQEFRIALVRCTMDGVGAFDRFGRVNAWNPALAHMTGRMAADVEGRMFGDLLPFLPAGAELRILTDALAGHATTLLDLPTTNVLSSEAAWVDVTVTPMRALDGRVLGGLLVARDVTERKHAADLIIASRDDAEEANRAKSDFLARMSHELRTPLNAVIGFTSVVLRNRERRLSTRDVTYLERIGVNGRHLLTLINAVLDLAKIEAGHETIELKRTAVGALVQETTAALEIRATDAGVNLVVDAPRDAAAVTDPGKLTQVLINLIGNAIKFTPRGGEVRVRVVSDAADSGAASIEVSDTGIGIPGDRLHAIFEAFEQADKQTSRCYGGTGLGLAISQQLCTLMGHQLDVQSELGAGSRFTVVLSEKRWESAA